IYGRFVNDDWPLADPESNYRLIGTRIPITGVSESFEAGTIQEIIDHFAHGATAYGGVPSVYIGYSAATPNYGTAGNPQSSGNFGIHRSTPQPDVTQNTAVVLAYQNYEPVDYIDSSVQSSTTCPLVPLQSSLTDLRSDINGTLFGKF